MKETIRLRLVPRRGMRVFLDSTARRLVDLMIRHTLVERHMLRGETIELDRMTILGAAVRHLAALTGVPPKDAVAEEPFAWVVFPSFTRAAGIAALFDLKLRIVAENSGALAGESVHREKIEEVAASVVRRYDSVATADERELLSVKHPALPAFERLAWTLTIDVAWSVRRWNVRPFFRYPFPLRQAARSPLVSWSIFFPISLDTHCSLSTDCSFPSRGGETRHVLEHVGR
jgi:hypothetical protein